MLFPGLGRHKATPHMEKIPQTHLPESSSQIQQPVCNSVALVNMGSMQCLVKEGGVTGQTSCMQSAWELFRTWHTQRRSLFCPGSVISCAICFGPNLFFQLNSENLKSQKYSNEWKPVSQIFPKCKNPKNLKFGKFKALEIRKFKNVKKRKCKKNK